MHLNIEIKAHSKQQDQIRGILRKRGADFRGIDHQIDTYFFTDRGRLKLRQGNIENNLIFYRREDKSGPKASEVFLHAVTDRDTLRETLSAALGIRVEVDKQREIYFIDNVKFHLDEVKELGTFVEIEAIDIDGSIGSEQLYKQCQYYLALFNIQEQDLITNSYSDLLLTKSKLT